MTRVSAANGDAYPMGPARALNGEAAFRFAKAWGSPSEALGRLGWDREEPQGVEGRPSFRTGMATRRSRSRGELYVPGLLRFARNDELGSTRRIVF